MLYLGGKGAFRRFTTAVCCKVFTPVLWPQWFACGSRLNFAKKFPSFLFPFFVFTLWKKLLQRNSLKIDHNSCFLCEVICCAVYLVVPRICTHVYVHLGHKRRQFSDYYINRSVILCFSENISFWYIYIYFYINVYFLFFGSVTHDGGDKSAALQ